MVVEEIEMHKGLQMLFTSIREDEAVRVSIKQMSFQDRIIIAHAFHRASES